MILEQSNDQYPRALTELVIFAHSKINNHIQDQLRLCFHFILYRELNRLHDQTLPLTEKQKRLQTVEFNTIKT